jgi:hypothetical protein
MTTDLTDLLSVTTEPGELVAFGRYCSEKLIEDGYFSTTDRERYRRGVGRSISLLREMGHGELARLLENEHTTRKTLGRMKGLTNGELNTIDIRRECWDG